MKSNKGKGLLGLLGLLVVLGIFGFFGYDTLQKSKLVTDENGVTSQNGGIKLGLDLAGGVSITYQAKEENPSAEDMSDTQYKLQQRVQNYSSEAEVYQEGGNRINVDIPGVTDANKILEELGKPGSLQFYDENWNVVLEGTDVASAKAVIYKDQQTGNNNYEVALTFTDEGTKKFADVTAANVGKKIAIVYDNVMYSNPTVQQAITGGQASISGMTSYEEAENLASTIRIGSLSLKLEEINSSVVGAQLGSAAVSTSVKAGAIGIVLIILFLAIVYRLPGIAAGWALLIYVELNLIALNAFDLTLTLPGIAGVILSIGMAVDANVIIYARIEEEIGAGKTVHAAIRDGFKKAASAILDGNVTTLIAAAVLYALASGSVRGFAMTLALGIVLSMFSAMVVSRLLVNSLYGMGLKDAKYYGTKKERKGFPFVEKRKIFFTISCILLLAVPASMIFMHQTKGSALNFGLDFKGGTSINVPFNEDYSIEELDKEVEPVVEGVTKDSNIQMTKVVGGNNVIIKTRSLTLEEREQVYQAMADNFGVDTSEITFDNISSTVSKEMSQNAMKAVIIAVVCMLLYIWIRFRDIRFASSAILALMHDIAIVFGFYVVSRISVGSTFIACMLTILGYSINSTIVIFDRIRENLPELKREPIESLVDRCITDTLTRSIYSSLTTFITIFVLFVMGVSSIRDFAAPLMVGIVCGAYTSVCITGALWYVMKHVGKNKYVPSKAVQNKTKNK